MRVSIIKEDKITNQLLPLKVSGSFWLSDIDKDGNETKLILIEAFENTWKIKSDSDVKIIKDNKEVSETVLNNYNYYQLNLASGESFLIYCCPINDPSYFSLFIKNDCELLIGKDDNNNIIFNSSFISDNHCKLIYKEKKWSIVDLKSEKAFYINNELKKTAELKYGDVIFVMGLKIIVLLDYLLLNNPKNILKLKGNYFEIKKIAMQNLINKDEPEEDNINLYETDDFYHKSPRFNGSLEKQQIVIDPPPQKENMQDMPLIYVIGPALTMGMTSSVTAFTTVNSVISQGRPFSEAIPSLLISSSMLITMILWPLLSKKLEKKQKIAREKKRRELYSKYIEKKELEIKTAVSIQRQILTEKFQPLPEVRNTLVNKKKNLWEREIFHDDFLDLRVGNGQVSSEIDVLVPEEKFSLEEDDLKASLKKIKNNYSNIPDAPVHFSFLNKKISSIIGSFNTIQKFFDGLLLQLMTFHSYDDLKIVVLTDSKSKNHWDYLKTLPHCWNNDKTIRFIGSNLDNAKEISSYLENIIQSRKSFDDNNQNNQIIKPYFLVFTDNIKKYRDLEIIKTILNGNNIGFSLIILNERISNLPSECRDFISIGDDLKSGIFENDLTSGNQSQFIADISEDLNLSDCAEILAGTPIEESASFEKLPSNYGFLEMYNVGKIEQLNVINRWRTNTPSISLQAPIGTDEYGNLIKLDLHEKYHGPHGLIAGMTGSGKSELIITYILSMAVNFHPNEVSFILIDYKGGGIAGAFENRELGIKLPHIVGTITNLDTIEMSRSLASIKSEIRRRQEIFKKEKNRLNESTLDIYKYQKLYREGIIKEPVSHLFIICDEFAELKSQQPDFMDELISAARIGRSLGIHLILATQKPSGVVDDQIWSNSRFRICLKVQEQSDSNDMIKRPDASYIKDIGRFYLQVGYNEMFLLGQSAWCGEKYNPVEKLKKKIDPYISFINDIGVVIKNIKEEKVDLNIKSYGEVLPNVINYIINISKEEKIQLKQLWLNRIPNIIYIDNLMKKYSYVKDSNIINPIIGEFDDPDNQKQGLLTINLTENGNTIIYGSSGSGKSLLITDIIYSSIINYKTSDVNFYILDFGAETLGMFKNAPQVGDVVFLNEEEKTLNMLKLLFKTIEERKNLFSKYGGDFISFNRSTENKVPLIVAIINNFEVFTETYEQLEDMFVILTREGPKYGIVFVITVSGANNLRYKLKQNFKQSFVLQLNDNSDYNSIFGNVYGKYPSVAIGRGIIKTDDIHEFQTAYPYEVDKLNEYIEVVCEKLRAKAKYFAPRVPVLPKKVTSDYLLPAKLGIKSMPLGVEKDSLNVSTWNFEKNYGTLVTAEDEEPIINFLPAFLNQFSNLEKNITVIVDAKKLFNKSDFPNDVIYIDSNFNNFIDNLDANITKITDIYKNNGYDIKALTNIKHFVCVIVDTNYLFKKLDDAYAEKFKNLLKIGQIYEKMSYIIVNTIEIAKKLEYDEWYKTLIKDDEGIWIGSGIGNQFTLKLSKNSSEFNKKISFEYGYVVTKGNPVFVKFIQNSDLENNSRRKL